MSKIKAGIVLVNKYCTTDDSRFRGYIDYIDRDEAVRNEYIDQFNLYQDYMDDPEKTTGLFTGVKNYLTRAEKIELKEVFKTAQENGSLMWQPVISFDNQWLEENGLWDSKRKILDEVKMKEFTQKSVNKMLKSEGLVNAVWSASFHYNTDNIHIHIAIVEPNPMREKKRYKVYDYVPDQEGDYIYSKYNTYLKATKKNILYYSQNGKRYRREERIGADGKNVFSEEYKGKFQEKSLELCKSTFVNEILQDKDYGIKINALIRDSIVKRKTDIDLHADPDLKRVFLDLHASMPRKGNRGLWNYNNNIMKPLQQKIDRMSDLYLEKYHPKEMRELRELLQTRSEQYEKAYGESQREYAENKLQELHTRLGNAILKEIRKYDQLLVNANSNFYEAHEELSKDEEWDVLGSIRGGSSEIPDNEKKVEISSDILGDETELGSGPDVLGEITDEIIEIDHTELLSSEPENNTEINQRYREWFSKNSEFKKMISEEEINIKKVMELSISGVSEGNPLIAYATGDLYKKGIGGEINLELAEQYYKKAFSIFLNDVDEIKDKGERKKSKFDLEGYISYRIGKQYLNGNGTELDYENAIEWLEHADNPYANFTLGNIYYYGEGAGKDLQMAVKYYEEAAAVPFANLKLAKMYEKGEYFEKSEEQADGYYKKAYDLFLKNEKTEDPMILYQLANLLYDGKGCKKNVEKAKKLLEKSAKHRNEDAIYKLSKIFIEEKDIKNYPRVIKMLTNLSEKGENEKAQYALGKFYLNEETEYWSLELGEKYLKMSADKENAYAQYALGKFYLNEETEYYNLDLAIGYLQKAAEQNNMYAQYMLGKLFLNKAIQYYDPDLAVKYLKKSAEQDCEYAQYALGKLFFDKEEKFYDPEEGIMYLKKAAEMDNVYALCMLGKIHGDKNTEYYDPEQGHQYLLRAIEKDSENEYVQYLLGKFYLNRDTEYYNVDLAEEYLRKSADQDCEYAKLSLGKLYLDKEEKYYRPKLAEKYLLSALEKGNQSAQYLLGKTYLDNESELYNPQMGLRYMFELSEKGNQYAQIKLGLEYIKGVHVPRDVSAGCELLTKAQEQGNPVAACILDNIHRNEMFFHGKQAVKTLVKDMKRMNTYMSYKIDKALRVLKDSMDQEHEKARRQNQYEYDQLMNLE